MRTLRSSRCDTCHKPMTGLARLTTLPARAVFERFRTPPADAPADAIEVEWMADPCLHPLTNVQAWDAAIEAGWGELPTSGTLTR